MPLAHRRDPTRGWILVDVHDPLLIDEVIDLIRSVRSNVADRMVPMLVDARAARTPISDHDIDRGIAAVDEAVKVGGSRGHVAIVADHEAVFAAMVRYEAGCARLGISVIRVFREWSVAGRWLEIVSAAREFR